ncbi:hypothetical protein CKC_03380 [Candidatus Liberibacter solanacearum CLso-ZC1]|uniref:Uncharacterized protein n=1 Tax=Liberibacter solanacearum (strain CLso-ZC1) TaxID=658172 RepID=E4UB34_LIBSC|nr:hypothetical protein [Candidatus Liberibacter solanacearum]ADR52425.1 hypothetical protein CKC_03380 [Candidatus Liberibacter solanacearum CLso-ZC1]
MNRYVTIPRIDIGEPFGGLSGKKRRVFKVSLRVINTANLEIRIGKDNSWVCVEQLQGAPKIGEFEVFMQDSCGIDSELTIRQTSPSPFCLTSITAHLATED